MPELYVLETIHWGKLDLQASGLGGTEYCSECRMTMPPVKEPERLVIDQSTFDREVSDFFDFFPWEQVRPFVTR